jgi:hypothetical protein
MIEFKNDQFTLGFTFRYKHYIYNFRYLKLHKKFDIGRQYL